MSHQEQFETDRENQAVGPDEDMSGPRQDWGRMIYEQCDREDQMEQAEELALSMANAELDEFERHQENGGVPCEGNGERLLTESPSTFVPERSVMDWFRLVKRDTAALKASLDAERDFLKLTEEPKP